MLNSCMTDSNMDFAKKVSFFVNFKNPNAETYSAINRLFLGRKTVFGGWNNGGKKQKHRRMIRR